MFCRRVLHLQEVKRSTATSRSIALAFEGLNDEGSACTFLHDQTTHTVGMRGSDLDDSIMHYIFHELVQCAPLSGYEENTQQIWSVTLLAPDA